MEAKDLRDSQGPSCSPPHRYSKMIEAFSSKLECGAVLLRPSAPGGSKSPPPPPPPPGKRKRRSSCGTTTPARARECLRGFFNYQLQPEHKGKLVRWRPPAKIF